MHIDELAARFNLTRRTIRKYVTLGIIERPTIGRNATYPPDSAARIAAYRALSDNNTSLRELAAHLQEEGITVLDYVRQREAHIRAHGLSPAYTHA